MNTNARAAGVHEQMDPAATARRFPGARWTREFIPASAPALSRSGTARQLIAAVKAQASPGWSVDQGGAMVSLRVETIRREADWLAVDPIGRTRSFYLWWNSVGKEHFEGRLLDPAGVEAVATLIARFVRLPALHAWPPVWPTRSGLAPVRSWSTLE